MKWTYGFILGTDQTIDAKFEYWLLLLKDFIFWIKTEPVLRRLYWNMLQIFPDAGELTLDHLKIVMQFYGTCLHRGKK